MSSLQARPLVERRWVLGPCSERLLRVPPPRSRAPFMLEIDGRARRLPRDESSSCVGSKARRACQYQSVLDSFGAAAAAMVMPAAGGG